MFPRHIKWTSANLRESANLDTNEVPGHDLSDLTVQRVGFREFPRSTFSPRGELVELLREGDPNREVLIKVNVEDLMARLRSCRWGRSPESAGVLTLQHVRLGDKWKAAIHTLSVGCLAASPIPQEQKGWRRPAPECRQLPSWLLSQPSAHEGGHRDNVL